MSTLQLIILALVQGITEFLPISSSAHLIMAPLLVESWADQGPVIDVAAHIGSLMAVLLYFRQETTMLITGALKTLTGQKGADQRLFIMLAVASVPLLGVGVIIAITGIIDHLRSPLVIGIASIIFGILLWHSDRSPAHKHQSIDETEAEKHKARLAFQTLSWRDAMIIGFSQILALIPGASRSGVTMTASRYLGWSRSEAARFSMLLAIPSIAAIGFLASIDLFTGTISNASPTHGLIVAILSFIFAYAAIHIFLKLIQSMSLTPFVIYRLVMGVGLIIFALT